MMYHFAVAVEDSDLTTGPWSEVLDILWDGEYLTHLSQIIIIIEMQFHS